MLNNITEILKYVWLALPVRNYLSRYPRISVNLTTLLFLIRHNPASQIALLYCFMLRISILVPSMKKPQQKQSGEDQD